MSLPVTFVKGFHDEEACKRMEYRPLGKTGLKVSKISLGCGTLSQLYGDLDEKEAIETIHSAIRRGINYIDTAPFYGQGRSEEVLGKALKDVPREAYYIATKVGRYENNYDDMIDFSAKKTRESLEKSLKLLGLDYVDIIQIHDVEFAENLDIVINECLPVLEEFVKQGKARFIGATGYPIEPIKKCIEMAPGRFSSVLTYARYTLLDQTLCDYLPFFQEQNLGIVCAASHALGLLTNLGPQPWHNANDDIRAVCKKAGAICESAGIELGKLAMHFALRLDGPTTFLVGMQTRKLLDINLNSYYDGLTEKEQEILKTLQETVFTKSLNWEGIELEKYWSAIKSKKN